MKEDLDQFVERFQALMLEEAKETLGEIAFQRWQTPLYMGVILNADAVAHVKGACGDSMIISLKFKDGRVDNAAFQTDGCAPTIICGSFGAEMAIGKTPEEIMDITGEEIMARFGGLPKENEHCASLASGALHEAIHNYMRK